MCRKELTPSKTCLYVTHFYLSLKQPDKIGAIIPISHMTKLRHSVSDLPRVRLLVSVESQNWTPGLLGSAPYALDIYTMLL